MTRRATIRTWTVGDFTRTMDTIAPPGVAQPWDNVGLLVGDPAARVQRVLLCIDLTPNVADEGVNAKADLILAYHPPLFKPVNRLRADSTGTDAAVLRCARQGIAIYSPHTALDAAKGGTNDVLAALCGIASTEPIEYTDAVAPSESKIVVFVPEGDLDQVAEAMFAAGAGYIGDYSHCSYRTTGRGTFLGGDATQPTIGRRGRFELVDEVRLETIVKNDDLPAVVEAMVRVHSYEEPAFDIYPLRNRPVKGIGRSGRLPRPIALGTLTRKLKRATQTASAQIVGDAARTVEHAVIVVGSAGDLPFRVPLSPQHVIITGEMRHHDALKVLRHGCAAILLGHWSSERPVLPVLANRLASLLPNIAMQISAADQDPFHAA